MGLLNMGAAANTDNRIVGAFADGTYASPTYVGGERHFDIKVSGYNGTGFKNGAALQFRLNGPMNGSSYAPSDIGLFPKTSGGTGDSYRFTTSGIEFGGSSGAWTADLGITANGEITIGDTLKVQSGITSYGGIDIDETATAQLRMFNRSNVNDSDDYWDIRHANGGQLQFLYRDHSDSAWDHWTEFMEDGSILIQQNALRLWNYTSANSDITALTTGSTFGALIEGDQSGHLVLGIRGNDSSDGVYILKDETNSSGRGSYDTMLLRVDSNVGLQTGNGINLHVQGNAHANLYHSTLNDGYSYFRYGSSSLVDFQLRINSGNLEYSTDSTNWNTIATT